MRATWWVAALFTCIACGASQRGVSSVRLAGSDGEIHAIVAESRYTVLLFFSADCHILREHDARVRELAARFSAQGVRFLGVDSEVGATVERDREEASRRQYSFPIVVDPGARLAHAYGAEYAGHVVVLDPKGTVVYRGGIDSDRVHLTEDRREYLADALVDLAAGRSPRVAEAKTLGCALRTW
jgi:peroxiredoxin